MKPTAELVQLVTANSVVAASPTVQALIDQIKVRFSDSLQGVLYYGSCLRDGEDLSAMFDLYVIVDNYASAYGRGVSAGFNWLLPPNVYYLEREVEAGIARAKYAVISVADFESGVSTRWFHSYIWGRFTQPVQLVYSANDAVRQRLCMALATAVVTFVERVLPSMPEIVSPSELWQCGLALSYGAELRAEKLNRPAQLFDANQSYFRSLTQAVTDSLPVSVKWHDGHVHAANFSPLERRLNTVSWAVRRIQGKLLSVFRLVKALFTFSGGVDYIAWKLERHTGERIEITPAIRRHPLLHGWGLVWRLYRKGVFR